MSEPSEPPAGAPVGRRVFLGLVTLGGASVLAGGPLSRAFGDVRARLAEHDKTGLSSLVPGGGWRYYTVTGGFPGVDPAAYRLRVTGLVDRPLRLTIGQVGDLPRTRLVRDFQCVTGWRVPDVRWDGVRLSHLLRRAGVRPGAGAVQFLSFDGAYSESLTMEQAMRPDVLVADRLEQAPVSRQHGGPLRLVVAPMYGYKNCKWLAEIRVLPRIVPGFWEHYGYDQDGWVGRSNGRDDEPT